MATEGVRTWADGFGGWWVEVSPELTTDPDVAAVIARGAIMAELAGREHDLSAEAVGVYRVHSEGGWLRFHEYDPRADAAEAPDCEACGNPVDNERACAMTRSGRHVSS